jgi:hypothetical protein
MTYHDACDPLFIGLLRWFESIINLCPKKLKESIQNTLN